MARGNPYTLDAGASYSGVTALLVTGGRDYCEHLDANGFPIQLTDERSRVVGVKTKEAAMDERRALGFALDFAWKWSGAIMLVHGGARGADRWAGIWADKRGYRCEVVEADWKRHGRGAGPIRDQLMLDKYAPSHAVSFPGGRGTADMVKRLREAEVDIFEVKA